MSLPKAGTRGVQISQSASSGSQLLPVLHTVVTLKLQVSGLCTKLAQQ